MGIQRKIRPLHIMPKMQGKRPHQKPKNRWELILMKKGQSPLILITIALACIIALALAINAFVSEAYRGQTKPITEMTCEELEIKLNEETQYQKYNKIANTMQLKGCEIK